jgi:hypothetical protein
VSLVSFSFVQFSLVSFSLVSFRLVYLRFVSFNFVLFRFVYFHFVLLVCWLAADCVVCPLVPRQGRNVYSDTDTGTGDRKICSSSTAIETLLSYEGMIEFFFLYFFSFSSLKYPLSLISSSKNRVVPFS